MTTIQTLIDRAARRYPWREAISCERRLSYLQLKQRTERLCSALYGRGLQPGDRVAVLMQNCHQHLELLHGLPAHGLTVVPLNWRLAPPEIEQILGHCGARALFVSKDFLPAIEQIKPGTLPSENVVLVDDHHAVYVNYEQLLESASQAPCVTVDENDRAYILYTSGTTGFPKGAVLTHRNVIDSAVWGVSSTIFRNMGHDDSMLVFVPLYHVAGTVTVMCALAAGARCVLMKKVDIPTIFEKIQAEKITRMTVVPFIVHHMLEYPEGHRYDLSSLRTVLYAAAPMPVPLLKRAIERFGPVFAQGYGLTETGPSGTMLSSDEHSLALQTGREHILASAGREMLHCDVRVVDEQGKDVPTGEIGEVIIRSSSVMEGYWKSEEATRESLRDGWFFSGDMGRFDEEGYLYLVDRKKDMIISGGENIYPKEVETVLLQHPAVTDCAVIGIPDEEWGEKVVAAVVVRHQVAPADLIGFCRQSLAGYKCPKAVHLLGALPRNPSGKVLKRELRSQLRECKE